MSARDDKKQRKLEKRALAGPDAVPSLPDLRRKAIVILGMHRSGTSALTGALAEMGCVMPEHLMAAKDANPKGFFESDAITGLNDQLLASAGRSWDSFEGMPGGWAASPDAERFARLAVETIRAEFGHAELFAMKDPRVCRLVPFWDAALREAGCSPLYVCTHRHPIDVASSMGFRGGYATDYALLLWLRHQLEAEAGSRGRPRVFVSYEQLLADWAASITKIGAVLNVAWPLTLDEARPGIEGFLSNALRNFAARSGEDARMPAWVADVYETLERWAALGEDAADYPRLDAIRAHLEAMTPTMAGMIGHYQDRVNAARHQAGLIAGLENDREADAARLRNAQEELGRLDSIYRQRAQEIEDHTREAAQLRAQLAEMRDGAERLRVAHEALVARHAREARQLQQMTARIAGMMLRDVDARLDAGPGVVEGLAGKGDGAPITEAAAIARITELEQELATLARHSSGLEAAVQELTTSTSWAMTRPLRWVSARVRRRR